MLGQLKSLSVVAVLINCGVGALAAQQQHSTRKATVALVNELPNASLGAVVQRSQSGTVILLDPTSSIADLKAALQVVRVIAAKPPMRPDGFESFGISKTAPEAVRDPVARKNLESTLATLHVASRRNIDRLGQVRVVDVSLEPNGRSLPE